MSDETRESVARGLAQSARGEVHDLGDFVKYAGADYEPTDEMVNAACRAMWEGRTGRKWGERSAFSDEARADARNMLAAVWPMIAAGALREAGASVEEIDGRRDDAAAAWLNGRADRIEERA